MTLVACAKQSSHEDVDLPVVSGDDVVSSHMLRTVVGGVNRFHLVQECRYPEENLATSLTSTPASQ